MYLYIYIYLYIYVYMHVNIIYTSGIWTTQPLTHSTIPTSQASQTLNHRVCAFWGTPPIPLNPSPLRPRQPHRLIPIHPPQLIADSWKYVSGVGCEVSSNLANSPRNIRHIKRWFIRIQHHMCCFEISTQIVFQSPAGANEYSALANLIKQNSKNLEHTHMSPNMTP